MALVRGVAWRRGCRWEGHGAGGVRKWAKAIVLSGPGDVCGSVVGRGPVSLPGSRLTSFGFETIVMTYRRALRVVARWLRRAGPVMARGVDAGSRGCSGFGFRSFGPQGKMPGPRM